MIHFYSYEALMRTSSILRAQGKETGMDTTSTEERKQVAIYYKKCIE